MSKKTKGIVLIILGISIALLGVFILNSKDNKKITSPPIVQNQSEKSLAENKINTATLEINGIKYESEILKQISIYDFMDQLRSEGKITFKEKNYTGMGKFIEEINGIKNREKYWIYYVNGEKANIGVSNYQINSGDVVSWKYENNY
jgi:hypothetical protein